MRETNPCYGSILLLFFVNDTAPTEIYTLSLHDALPISLDEELARLLRTTGKPFFIAVNKVDSVSQESNAGDEKRSEEHTSELQSLTNLVCRLLLEKKKQPYS